MPALRSVVHTRVMKVYLATVLSNTYLKDEDFTEQPYALQTFYDMNDLAISRMKYCKDVMIDSGAFSIRSKKAEDKDVYWEYLYRYADFINKYDIKHFFELDIDNLVGYDEVLRYRKKLEELTNKQPIVVWHLNRGVDEFIKHCEEYDYVALGGYAGMLSQKAKNDYKRAYPWFIKTAHQHNAKIHGLGFTAFKDLPKCHFDSVDSTSWLSGARSGAVAVFDGKKMKMQARPDGKRVISKRVVEHSFKEWLKFQKYAEVHL